MFLLFSLYLGAFFFARRLFFKELLAAAHRVREKVEQTPLFPATCRGKLTGATFDVSEI